MSDLSWYELPNLGDPPFTPVRAHIARTELLLADGGAPIEWIGEQPPCDGLLRPKLPVVAAVRSWEFVRYWAYWGASTGHRLGISSISARPIPLDLALTFDRRWHGEVRVRGCVGGQEPKADVFSYHIDTLCGLAAFIALLGEL